MSSTQPDWRDVRIVELEKELAETKALLKAALERIAQLERQLGLNSRNSSKPPSSDNEKARKVRRRRAGSGRSQGGQPGHTGHCRALLPEEQVDHMLSYFPSHCDACGLELSELEATGKLIRHQVFDVVPKLIECTEHRA